MSPVKHFLDLDLLDAATLRLILDEAHALAKDRNRAMHMLDGKTLALVFEKPSTRTRVSFQVGMRQLGGEVVVLSSSETQLGRGETVADTARVLSRYVDVIMLRTNTPEKMNELAAFASVPVINGLTDRTHPCQVMADVMTFEQHRGSIASQRIAWVGDGNNMAHSWIQAAAQFGFSLHLACPGALMPDPTIVAWARQAGASIELTEDAGEATDGAACVVTDTWVSMGDKEAATRLKVLEPYRVDATLMAKAAPDALFMHCLPAHRGDEVTDEVMDGPWSVVWDEAENRVHAQKAILLWCLDALPGGAP